MARRPPRAAAGAGGSAGAGAGAGGPGGVGPPPVRLRAARALLEERLTLARAGDDRPAVARCLMELGQVACQQGDYAAARRLLEESLAVFATAADDRRARPARGASWGRSRSAWANPRGPACCWKRACRRSRRPATGCSSATACATSGMWRSTWATTRAARARFAEAHQIASAFGDRTGLAYLLENFAYLAAAEARAERALRLAGAAAGLRERLGAPLPPTSKP